MLYRSLFEVRTGDVLLNEFSGQVVTVLWIAGDEHRQYSRLAAWVNCHGNVIVERWGWYENARMVLLEEET